jgi:eukaryotic-like serine/threonine-protein kinase
MLLAHASEEAPSFAEAGAAGLVPYAVEQLVQDCLSKNPNERPNAARELAERYDAAMNSSVTAAALAAARASLTPLPAVSPSRATPRVPALPQRPSDNSPPRAMPSGRVAIMPQSPTAGTATTPVETTTPLPDDPLAVIHHMDAWMPERIATYKVCGFIDDAGGEVVESVPGRIRVRLGGKGCVYATPKRPNSLSWFGFNRKMNTFDMELRLQRGDNARDAQLRITLVLRSPTPEISTDPVWQKLCAQIYCDLRAYLMAQSGTAAKELGGG